jgi:hypothetical protein
MRDRRRPKCGCGKRPSWRSWASPDDGGWKNARNDLCPLRQRNLGFLLVSGKAFVMRFGFFTVVEIFSSCYNKDITKGQEVL